MTPAPSDPQQRRELGKGLAEGTSTAVAPTGAQGTVLMQKKMLPNGKYFPQRRMQRGFSIILKLEYTVPARPGPFPLAPVVLP